MHFTIIAAIFAGMAIAAPTYETKTTAAPAPTNNPGYCNQYPDTSPSCCTNDSSSKGGVIGGIADGLLSSSCSLNILSDVCSPDQVQACCPTNSQSGLINVGSVCIPINV